MSDNITNQLTYLNETKQMLKQAIIDKGQALDDTTPFRNYVEKVSAIETGVDTSDATANTDDILNPKTAYVNGEKLEGQIYGDYDTLKPDLEDNSVSYSTSMQDVDYEYSIAVRTDRTNIYVYDVTTSSISTTTKFTLNKSLFGNKDIYNVVFGNNTDSVIKLWVASHTNSSNLEIHLITLKYDGTIIDNYKYTNTTWMGDGMWYGVGNILIPHPSRDIVCWVNPTVTNGGKCNTIIVSLINGNLTQLYYSRTGGHTNSYYSGPSTITGSWSADGRYVSCIYRASNGDINNIVVLCNETYTGASSVVSGIPSSTTCAIRLNTFIKNNQIYENNAVVHTLPYSIKSYYAIVVFSKYICILHNNTLDVFDINTYELLNTFNEISNIYIVHKYLCLKVLNATVYRFLGVSLSADYTALTRKSITYYDTSDANVKANDVRLGKIAFSNSKKVTGTLPEVSNNYNLNASGTYGYYNTASGYLEYVSQDYPKDTIMKAGSFVRVKSSNAQVAQIIGLNSGKLKSGETVLGIKGTAPITFATVEELEANTNFPEDTFAIVYGTSYVGTYRLDNGTWTQIGDSSQNQQIMDVLNDVGNSTDQYEGNGGTDEEISAKLDLIIYGPQS